MSAANVSIEKVVSYCNHHSEGNVTLLYTYLSDEYMNLASSARTLAYLESAGLIRPADLESNHLEIEALTAAAAHVKKLRDIAYNKSKAQERERQEAGEEVEEWGAKWMGW